MRSMRVILWHADQESNECVYRHAVADGYVNRQTDRQTDEQTDMWWHVY